ncbi:unnamed protein product [Peniophora sp. CBMAI 1063]|nr:unnamed protein product [Peniophora sp. CBMAI 1063]
MRLTFHFERVGWPLASFLGLLDLKTGVQIALYFAIINKVAGVYGLIALLTGAGGTVAQLSLYIYSVGALVASIWAMRAVNEEDPKRTLYFAHLFFADHILNTVWTVFFAVDWWVYTPHDGRRIANSPAQEALIDGYIGKHIDLAPADRIVAAETLWKEEKNVAMTIIVLGWLSKFYLAALIYSFAHHLRRGTYRSLPLSRSQPPPKETLYQPTSALPAVYDEEDDAPDAFYARSPATPVFSPINPSVSHEGHRGTPSTGTFAEFVGAPRTRGNGARSAGGSTVNLTADVGGRV